MEIKFFSAKKPSTRLLIIMCFNIKMPDCISTGGRQLISQPGARVMIHNALDLLKTALKDKYYGLRLYTLQKLNIFNDSVKKSVEPILG